MKSEFEMIKLSSICKTNTSSYSSKDKWNNVNYLDTGNITQNTISEIQHIDITTEKLPSRAKRKVKYNSIIFSTVRPNQLHYGIIKNQPDNFLVSTGFTVIDIDEDKASADFIYYLLTQNDVVQHLQAIAEQSTSAYPSIKASDIENLNIMLPNLDTQKKIAYILRSLDEKIELNNKINENLEQQAQAIFKSWFVDFEPFGGVMPEEWKIDKLGAFVEIKRGGSPRPIQDYLSDNGYRWLKISDVTSLNSPYILEIKEHIKESGIKKTVMLKQGALVLSNSATPGIPKILDVDSCIHDGWLYFPQSRLSNEYLYLLFKMIRNDLVMLGNGSVFTNLKTDILRQFEITMPSDTVLSYFQEVIEPIFDTMKNIARENQRLSALRDTLLPKLMNGEIDVSKVKIERS